MYYHYRSRFSKYIDDVASIALDLRKATPIVDNRYNKIIVINCYYSLT